MFAPLAPYSSCAFIVMTKVTTSYWQATFSSPPMNLEGTDFFLDFHALLDEIENDDFVYVTGVDSSVESYWVAH